MVCHQDPTCHCFHEANGDFKLTVELGDSIASEGKGDYMFVEGKVTDVDGKPIANAIIDTWETDGHGQYDTQVCAPSSNDSALRLFTHLMANISTKIEKARTVEDVYIQLKMGHTLSEQSC